MGWSGYEDPHEAKAAREAAEKMAEAQALEDGRTEALCTAIVEGLGMIASAILAAAGKDPMGGKPVCCQSPELCGAEPGDCEGAPAEGLGDVGCTCDESDPEWCTEHGARGAGPADPELDGLLDDGARDAEQGK